MAKLKVINVNQSVYAVNDEIAARTREKLKKEKTFMVNLMASPGAGKTSVLLRTIEAMKNRYQIGIMEADIEATVDAEKMQDAGVRSIQVHTGGQCAMDAEMTLQALEAFPAEDLDLLVLENVGNLVCPAETDTGASKNVAILSVPEGDDKPLKYPLMFRVCHAVLINKIDTREFFPFDDAAVTERIHNCNPDAEIFFLSAKTGEGMEQWTDWLEQNIIECKNL
ncbi:MAG: hydrogenase nickel incorporation protein HypB [Anaerovoracaceae bacterium]